MKISMRWLTLTALCCSFATAVWGGDEKLASDLRGQNLRNGIDVIVRYKVPPTDAHYMKVFRAGGTLRHRFDLIRSGHYTVSPELLKELSNDSDVEYITPDRPLHGMLNITAATVGSNVANASGWTGAGIGVAVIDSGIVALPDFQGQQSRIVHQETFVGGTPADQYGHGTHVAGILGANGSGTVYIGMVPAVNIVNLRVLDQNGNGTDSGVIAAIDEAIRLKSQYNIRVINLSLGRPVFESASVDPLCQAVEAAWKAGIVVVVAAGNDGRDNSMGTGGYATITAPGNDPYVITVGAMNARHTTTRSDDVMTSYSSKGPTLFDYYVKPDVVAPGNQVTSLLPAGLTLANEYPQNEVAGSHFTMSGTSMATPVVSGAAVMLLQKNPALTPDQVKARLMRTATKNFPTSTVVVDPVTHVSYPINYDIFTVGAGYLSITAALADTTLATGWAFSPQVTYNFGANDIELNGASGQSSIWGSNVVWGANTVWGASVLQGLHVVWGSAALGAAGTLQGLHVIWGANVVWSASITDAAEASTVLINGDQF